MNKQLIILQWPTLYEIGVVEAFTTEWLIAKPSAKVPRLMDVCVQEKLLSCAVQTAKNSDVRFCGWKGQQEGLDMDGSSPTCFNEASHSNSKCSSSVGGSTCMAHNNRLVSFWYVCSIDIYFHYFLDCGWVVYEEKPKFLVYNGW